MRPWSAASADSFTWRHRRSWLVRHAAIPTATQRTASGHNARRRHPEEANGGEVATGVYDALSSRRSTVTAGRGCSYSRNALAGGGQGPPPAPPRGGGARGGGAPPAGSAVLRWWG